MNRLARAGVALLCAACFTGEPATRRESETPPVNEITIQAANEKLTARIIDLAGVTAVGIGECDGRLCLKVFVERLTAQLREAIPESIEGYRVEIEESGPIEALE